MEQITKISINTLKVHPRNQEFFDDIDGETYEQFKKSIQVDGVLTPIIVSPDMTIISGHQRYKACKELGIELIPAIIREELVDENLKLRQLIASNFGRIKNDPAKLRKAIVEYVELVGLKDGQRKDLKVRQVDGALSQEDIAKELGLDIRELQRILQIERNLIPELKQALDKGFISKTAALGICSRLDKTEQQELLTELTKLIGEKQDKASNKEVESLIDKIKELQEQRDKLVEKNTELLKKASELEQIKEKMKKLEVELSERPVVEKLKEVVPEDYDDLKNKVKDSEKYYRELKREYDKKVEQITELKKEIESLKSVSEEEQYKKKLKDSALFFCARVHDFIEKTGGFVWLSEHINELPEYERKSYIKAIEMVENWAFAMKANMKNYI